MSSLLPVHVLAGSLAIAAGSVALVTTKGAGLHRRAGRIFFLAMIVLAASAAGMSVWSEPNPGNVLQSLLTLYLVVTGLFAVRPQDELRWRVEWAALLLGLGVGVTHATFGFRALAAPGGTIGGYPPPMFFAFGSIALLAAAGDARMLLTGGIGGARRLARHLWRMCFATFIATASFFLGQADEFPEALRVWPLLALLGLFPLASMLYWLWRVRVRRSLRGVVTGPAPAPRIAPLEYAHSTDRRS